MARPHLLLVIACASFASAFQPPAGARVGRSAPRAASPLCAKKKKGDTVAKPVRERKVKDDKIEVDGPCAGVGDGRARGRPARAPGPPRASNRSGRRADRSQASSRRRSPTPCSAWRLA